MSEPGISKALPAARAALEAWANPEDAIIAVALAGAETGWQDEPGDPLSIFPEADRAGYEAWACDGFTSFGQWQISYRWNHDTVDAMAHAYNPCAARDWLLDVNNCAKAAYEVYVRQGWSAWSTYKTLRYHDELDEARRVVQACLAPAEDPSAPNPADLVNLLGYLQGDVHDAIGAAMMGYLGTNWAETDDSNIQALAAALNTLRTAGKGAS